MAIHEHKPLGNIARPQILQYTFDIPGLVWLIQILHGVY